jgi:hypothetical protein
MKQIVSGGLALALAGNGVAMVAAGRWWYGAVPGVTATGPFNPHFVKDIGAAYLVCGAALAWRAARPADGWGAAAAAAAFLVLHALIHVADGLAMGDLGAVLVRDFVGVFLIAALAAWAAWPAKAGA